jgi:hypothetical protein
MLFIDQNYWVASSVKKQFYTMLRVEDRGGDTLPNNNIAFINL